MTSLVVLADQQPRLSVLDQRRYAADPRRNHRQPGHLRFTNGVRTIIDQRRMVETKAIRIEPADARGIQRAMEDHIVHAQWPDVDAVYETTIGGRVDGTDDMKPQIGMMDDQVTEDLQTKRQCLQRVVPSHKEDALSRE